MRICGFTGYRPEKFPFKTDEADPACIALKKSLEARIRMMIEDGFTHFICGGARGADTFAAEAVLKLKREFPSVILEIAAPFWGQEKRWNPIDQARYHEVLEQAQKITYVCRTEGKESYAVRNKYIVDSCDRIIDVFDGKRGGTSMTVNYAEKRGVEVVQIFPDGKVLERSQQLFLFSPQLEYDIGSEEDFDEYNDDFE